MSNTGTIITRLRALLLLTNAEIQVARTRTTQARTEAKDVRTLLAYEEHNKNRQGVVSASQTHLATLVREAAGV